MLVKMIDITLTKGVISPQDLSALLQALPVPAGGEEGIVISGRMPVWAFAAIIHHFHPRPWVGTFDPRLGGAVVVASHTASMTVGSVVPVDSDASATTVIAVGFAGGDNA